MNDDELFNRLKQRLALKNAKKTKVDKPEEIEYIEQPRKKRELPELINYVHVESTETNLFRETNKLLKTGSKLYELIPLEERRIVETPPDKNFSILSEEQLARVCPSQKLVFDDFNSVGSDDEAPPSPGREYDLSETERPKFNASIHTQMLQENGVNSEEFMKLSKNAKNYESGMQKKSSQQMTEKEYARSFRKSCMKHKKNDVTLNF